MSSGVDLQGFLGAYLAEADEHLANANERTLAIEAALTQGTSNGRAVRDLFRILHTIKGLSAMVGVEPVVVIAHHLESILRAADRGTAALTPAAIEVVFESLRAIEQRLRAIEKGAPPAAVSAALLARLEKHDGHGERAEVATVAGELDLAPELAARLAPFEREQLLKGGAEGRRVLCAQFVPSPKRAAEGLTINSVRERVGSLAEIVKVIPLAIPSSDAAPGGLSFQILLVTSAEELEIATAAGCESAAVRSIVRARAVAVDAEHPAAAIVDDDGDPLEIDREDTAFGDSQARTVLRVDVGRVDEAMDRLAALIVTRSRLARAVAAMEGQSGVRRELQSIVQESSRQLRDMRASLLRIRMVPFSEVLARLPLVVRGLRRTTGKEVRLETQAADAELDKSVAERVFPALVHLVRNAVDHGLGTPEERVREGKPTEGTVRIVCSSRTNRQLALQVIDDGRGIDRAALARSIGMPIAEGDGALLDVLCRPGLSTRTEATTTSGRGMGMDIVRKIVVEQLGGELTLETTPGVGTTFTLLIPLTVSILDAFIVQCGDERFAVPVSIVEEIIELDARAVVRGPALGGGATALIERRGDTIPVVELSRILGAARDAGARQALIVRRGSEPVAFALDRVLTQQETVVRPLVDPLVQVAGIAGSTDLGDGRPTLVLDLVAMVAGLGRSRLGESGRAA